jgi:penicillin-binding protein 2
MGWPRRRLLVFSLFITAVAGIFLFRLLQLQVIHGEEYRQLSLGNFQRRIRVAAPRGRILDRNGKILADNEPNFQLALSLPEMKGEAEALTSAGLLTGLEKSKLQEILLQQRDLPRHYPRVLVEHLTRDEWARLQAEFSKMQSERGASDNLNGLHLQVQYERVYPFGENFSHLLGYVRQAGPETLKEWDEKDPGRVGPDGKVGIKGVEKSFDEALRGHDGFRQHLVDARGRAVDFQALGLAALMQDIPVTPGADLHLTVDADLNRTADQAFGDKVGALVALDPQNGEVLAWVSKPSYSPELLSKKISGVQWLELRDHPDKILLNRPLQGAYPPGSVHKIVTAVAAVSEGKVDFNEKIHCPGYYRWGGRNWGCWNHGGHGAVNLVQALKYSCDVFFYKMGERLGPDLIAKYAAYLGLGEKTGVLQDSERSGLIPTEEWKEKQVGQGWKNSDNLGNAIGQGYNLVTPMQNALMVARFANGGKKIQAHLLLKGQSETPEALPWNLTPEQWKQLREALHQVVDGGGTGRMAKVPGVSVAGKTGTAQVVSLDYRGKGRREDHAWFVAFAPVEDPQIALAVLVEHGGSGGKAAGPIAQKVLAEYFGKSTVDSRQREIKIP